MKLSRIFSPVQIIFDQPEEVDELINVLEGFLHSQSRLPWKNTDKYARSMLLLTKLRDIPTRKDF